MPVIGVVVSIFSLGGCTSTLATSCCVYFLQYTYAVWATCLALNLLLLTEILIISPGMCLSHMLWRRSWTV